MKKIMSFLLLLLSLLFLNSCAGNNQYDIITSLFPHYDIATNIAGDKMSVNLLTNPGVEVHDFSPSSKQISKIKYSKLFLFTSYEIDTWLNENEQTIIGENTISLNMSKGYTMYEDENHEEENEDHHDHDHDHVHYWTDPLVMIELTDYVLNKIIQIDPLNKDYYISNANSYKNKILLVHEKLENYFSNLENITIYFSGHNAMHGFESRYHFTIKALSNTSKPDADITSNQVLELIKDIKNNNIYFLYTEELKEPKVANTIKSELAKENHLLNLRELHGYHNLTKEDFNNKVTYYELLERNYQNIKEGLDFNENFRG